MLSRFPPSGSEFTNVDESRSQARSVPSVLVNWMTMLALAVAADPSVPSVHLNWTIMLNLAVSVLGLAG